MPDQPCDESPAPKPTDLDKADVAREINKLLNHYITVMDTKASAFLAGNVAAASFLLNKMPADGGAHIAWHIAATLFAASTLIAGGVIFPRLPKAGNSVLFWGDIAHQKDLRTYLKDFNRIVDDGFLDEQYCVQNFFTARVLRRKFRWLRTSIVLFFAALFIAFGVYVNV